MKANGPGGEGSLITSEQFNSSNVGPGTPLHLITARSDQARDAPFYITHIPVLFFKANESRNENPGAVHVPFRYCPYSLARVPGMALLCSICGYRQTRATRMTIARLP